MLHRFTTSITDIPLPERFTYPFCYTPHPLCILAAKEVQSYLTRQTTWKDELRQGKMFGVLIVQTEHHPDNVASNSSFRRLGAELKATATVFGSYQRNMYILPW